MEEQQFQTPSSEANNIEDRPRIFKFSEALFITELAYVLPLGFVVTVIVGHSGKGSLELVGLLLIAILGLLFFSSPILLIMSIVQSVLVVKAWKNVDRKKLLFPIFVMALGYLLVAILLMWWLSFNIPFWKYNKEAKIQNAKIEQAEITNRQLSYLKEVRGVTITDDFINGVHIVDFVDMGDKFYSNDDLYTEHIGVLLDNNVKVSLGRISPNDKEKLLSELKNLDFKEMLVHSSDFTFIPDAYVCREPDFKNNTCVSEEYYFGANFRPESSNLTIKQYLNCVTSWQQLTNPDVENWHEIWCSGFDMNMLYQ